VNTLNFAQKEEEETKRRVVIIKYNNLSKEQTIFRIKSIFLIKKQTQKKLKLFFMMNIMRLVRN